MQTKWSPKIELAGSCTIRDVRAGAGGKQQKLKGATSEAGAECRVLRAAWVGGGTGVSSALRGG